MQKLILASLLVIGFSAQAAERSVSYLNDTIYIETDAHHLAIEDIAIRKVASKMRDISPCRSNGPDSDIEFCEEVSEKTEVVQVSFTYRQGSFEDDSYDEELNFPLSAFTADEIAQLRKLSKGSFDLFGKKAKARRRLALELMTYTTTRISFMKDIMECTRESRTSDSDLCEEWTKVGEKEVFMNKLQFVRK
ncbi:MAG: hypothetical protein AABZ31_02720 [Bdellovibrionota bacterium]